MKKIIILILGTIGTLGTVMGQPDDAKPYIIKGDTLFAHKEYRNAQEQYRMAYQFDRKNKYPKMMVDSITRMDMETVRAKDAVKDVKRLKDAGMVDLSFDEKGMPVAYKKADGIEKSVKLLQDEMNNVNNSIGERQKYQETYNVIMRVRKKDWEGYK